MPSYILTISTAGADDDVRWFHGPHALERSRNAARRAIPNTVVSMYAASADGGFRLSARHMMAEAIPVDTDTGRVHGPLTKLRETAKTNLYAELLVREMDRRGRPPVEDMSREDLRAELAKLNDERGDHDRRTAICQELTYRLLMETGEHTTYSARAAAQARPMNSDEQRADRFARLER